MAECWLCKIPVPGSGGRRYCQECANRVKHVKDVKLLLQSCAVCGIVGSWLMEEHDGQAICGNCHRVEHRERFSASEGSKWWPRQCQIDVLKSVVGCKTCGEIYPDKLLFVTEGLERIQVSVYISRKRLTKRLHGSEVYCWNCWRTARRDNA